MLGEQYLESKGKITSQRVLDVEGPTVETSIATSGTIKGTPVQVMLTFIGTLKRNVTPIELILLSIEPTGDSTTICSGLV
jgi:hypothetical protein